MDSSTLPILSQASDSTESSSSDETMDLESGTIHDSDNPVPGVWRFPTDRNNCCIYRVPSCIRRVNSEAYTPQLVIIGPLHHSLKSQALKSRGDITNTKFMDYLNMENHKKIYLKKFAKRFKGEKTIDEFRRMIEEDEEKIRASYSESTVWIESPEFVDMILHDSVFILELLLRDYVKRTAKIGDPLMDEPCLLYTVREDLIMLENQLPYFILDKLFDTIAKILPPLKLRARVIEFFLFEETIEDQTKFCHFTDLVRCVRVEGFIKSRSDEFSAELRLMESSTEFGLVESSTESELRESSTESGLGDISSMKRMYNADKLDNGRVKFKAGKNLSVEVKFDPETGCLEIPIFYVDEDQEITLRNIMAFEQCHCPSWAYVCSYVLFLDYLIDTDKDVKLLAENGIIPDWDGHHDSVAKMVNNLCLGVSGIYSYYSDIAVEVNKHCDSRINRILVILRRVYFNNIWAGTATITAACILLLTLTQTVTSIIEVIKK